MLDGVLQRADVSMRLLSGWTRAGEMMKSAGRLASWRRQEVEDGGVWC